MALASTLSVEPVHALLLRLAPQSSVVVQATLNALLNATVKGHVCMNLEQAHALYPSRWPGVAEWRAELLANPLVGQPGAFVPLILDGARLYLARHWEDETALAELLKKRLQNPPVWPPVGVLREALDIFFPPDKAPQPDRQREAAAKAAMQRLLFISGGPGTGKTTTAAKIRAVLQHLSVAPLCVRLAAPTGKAAARLRESLRSAATIVGQRTGVLSASPDDASTLHRLLGYHSAGFAFHRNRHLEVDLLIVDEASMVDLALLRHLFEAVPISCRVILLGDKDQLGAVDVGRVFADLCAARAMRSDAAAYLRAAGCDSVQTVKSTGILGECTQLLAYPYRFRRESGIGMLAAAVQRGDRLAVQQTLEARLPDIRCQPQLSIPSLAEGFSGYWKVVDRRAGVAAAFEAFAAFRVLTLRRTGPAGAQQINEQLSLLWQQGRCLRYRDCFEGRAILILKNDYEHALFNGDVGLLLPDAAGQLRAWFEKSDGSFQAFNPARLPAYESAFAMTVHKSQGSEFKRVALCLPAQPSPHLDRTLLYTAVTRAREELWFFGDHKRIEEAVSTVVLRASGLADRLSLDAAAPYQGTRG